MQDASVFMFLVILLENFGDVVPFLEDNFHKIKVQNNVKISCFVFTTGILML